MPVHAPVEEANAVKMDANAFAEFTIGQATKARYKQILSRFALMLREEKRAGMESHSEKDIREDVLSVFPFDALQWDDVNSFTKIFYYETDKKHAVPKMVCKLRLRKTRGSTHYMEHN